MLCYRPKKGQLRAVWRAHEVVVGAERYALPRVIYTIAYKHPQCVSWRLGLRDRASDFGS